jgi:pimeloyl-ACP methyl ester carboxylesterase
MAKDALALLDFLGWREPRSVHLVGLSMGGMITQELALLDMPRFASMALLSTIAGGLTSLGYFAIKMHTGVFTIARTFTTNDPREQLKRGMEVLYPEAFLEGRSLDPTTGKEESNFVLFRRALIGRGKRAKLEGNKPLPFSTVLKQGLGVASHRVSSDRLASLARHFGDAVLVVTGDSDILVHPMNSEVLAKELNATLITLPNAGHGANEQCAVVVNDAIQKNALRGAACARSRL